MRTDPEYHVEFVAYVFIKVLPCLEHMSENSQEHSPNNSHNLRDAIVLLGILVCMLILVVRPFGYRMFQIGLEQHNVFAVILVVGIVGITLVILQRLGIIFADYSQPSDLQSA